MSVRRLHKVQNSDCYHYNCYYHYNHNRCLNNSQVHYNNLNCYYNQDYLGGCRMKRRIVSFVGQTQPVEHRLEVL